MGGDDSQRGQRRVLEPLGPGPVHHRTLWVSEVEFDETELVGGEAVVPDECHGRAAAEPHAADKRPLEQPGEIVGNGVRRIGQIDAPDFDGIGAPLIDARDGERHIAVAAHEAPTRSESSRERRAADANRVLGIGEIVNVDVAGIAESEERAVGEDKMFEVVEPRPDRTEPLAAEGVLEIEQADVTPALIQREKTVVRRDLLPWVRSRCLVLDFGPRRYRTRFGLRWLAKIEAVEPGQDQGPSIGVEKEVSRLA